MISTMLTVISMCAAAVIFISGLFSAVNKMTRCTSVGIRFSWIFLTTGSLGVLISPFFHVRTLSISETILLVGIASYIIFERRSQNEWCRW